MVWPVVPFLSLLMAVAAVAVAPTTRGNTVLTRRAADRVMSVGAVVRAPILLGGGTGVMAPPVGFGAGLAFRFHAVPLGPIRFGFALVGGHSRILNRRELTLAEPDGTQSTVIRFAALDHTSFAIGPAFQIPLRVVFVEISGGVGVGIESFRRPLPASAFAEEHVTDVGVVARGDGHVGIPIRNNHGILLGGSFEKVFSSSRVVQDPADVDNPAVEKTIAPFDMILAPYLGYQGWF